MLVSRRGMALFTAHQQPQLSLLAILFQTDTCQKSKTIGSFGIKSPDSKAEFYNHFHF